MVNENTRMYIPEENHQGKAGPAARPGLQRELPPSPPSSGWPRGPGAGPYGVARGPSASPDRWDRGPNPVRRSGKFPPLPPSSCAGFSGACVSYEIPGEGEKFPKCLLLPRFLAFAWRAQLPGRPCVGEGPLAPPSPAVPSPVSRGPSPGSGRGWERARAHPAPGRPRARAAAGRPTRFQEPRPCVARCVWRVGARGSDASLGASLLFSSFFPSPSPLSPAHLHTPTSPLPLTPRVPTPGVFLFAPACELAPEDVSG